MSSFSISSSDDENDQLTVAAITDRSQLHLFIDDLSMINTPNDYGWTPLYRTIISTNLKATYELLKQGADPNQTNQMGETPLYQAVEMELYDQTQTLLNFNADPNIAKNDGMTPLLCAVKKSNHSLTKLLIENKAIVNLQNRLYKQTALHIALKSNTSMEIIQLLIENKASLTLKDKYDKTPLDYAELSNEELMSYLNNAIALKDSPSPKLFSTPLCSTSHPRGLNFNNNNSIPIKKVTTSNFSISTPQDDISANTYHENNLFTLENGLASFYTNNSKKQSSGKDIISEISPLELIITTSNNSHIFSELQENASQRAHTNSNYGQESVSPQKEFNKSNLRHYDNSSSSDTKAKNDENSSLYSNSNSRRIISELPITSVKKNEISIDMEYERPNMTKGTKPNSVKISYHRNSGSSNTSRSTQENNINILNCPKKNNTTSNNMSDLYDRQTDIDSTTNHTVYNKNSNQSSKLYSINSTHYQTCTNPLPINNTIKQCINDKNQSIFLNEYDSNNNENNNIQLEQHDTLKSDVSKATFTTAKYNKYTFTQVKNLHDWLTSIDLLCYFNTFIAKGLYEIEPLINQLKSGELSLTFRDIEELGIRKPGHIQRFMLKAQCDAGQFDRNLVDYLFKNSYYGNNNTINATIPGLNDKGINYLTFSNESTLCDCFIISKTRLSQDVNLSTWLNTKGLGHLKDNFIHNGFELLEYIMLQMFSSLPFTEENIIEFLHVYKESDRKVLLKELFTEKKKICEKFGFEFNEVNTYDEDVSNCQMCLIF